MWDKNYNGKCEFTNIHDKKRETLLRDLDVYETFVRYNEALTILEKVKFDKENGLATIISPLSPFGLDSTVRGESTPFRDSYLVYSSKGIGYIKKSDVTTGESLIDKYKVMVSKVTSEHAGEADKQGQYKVFTTLKLLEKNQVCTFSYFTIGAFDNKCEAENLLQYLRTKFVRFLLLQAVSSINLSKDKFCFVPMQDFTEQSDIDWSKPIPEIDKQLYAKYGLSSDEIAFIESMIKPME